MDTTIRNNKCGGTRYSLLLKSLALQPTTLCNLNCSYCYLPYRKSKKQMDVAVVDKVADLLRNSTSAYNKPVNLLWHSGEPLIAGLEKFEEYYNRLAHTDILTSIVSSIQTNATQIDDKWCDFFKKWAFNVGVSIDGNESHNKKRIKYSGKEAFDSIIKGINSLEKNRVPFIILAVISIDNIDEPENILDFFSQFQMCQLVGFNFEEVVGVNTTELNSNQIGNFWSRVIKYKETHKVNFSIREFDETIPLMLALSDGKIVNDEYLDAFPCIDVRGNISMLSPEFVDGMGMDKTYFQIGNVFDFNNFNEVLERANEVAYVQEFAKGVEMCSNECDYYYFCRGGLAANKYYEHGKLNVTTTNFCKNRVISLCDELIK